MTMKHGIYILTLLVIVLSLSESGYAKMPVFTAMGDTTHRVVIYYDENETGVDSGYKENNRAIATLDSLLSQMSEAESITALNVETFVSPDGDEAYNARLAAKRSDSIKEFIQRQYPHLEARKIHLTAAGEDWTELRRLVEADANVPDREEVLILIDYHRNDVAKRKQLVRKLNRGAAYRYIVSNLLPQLRRSVITVKRKAPEMGKETIQPASLEPEKEILSEEVRLLDTQPDESWGERERNQTREVVVSEAEKPEESRTVLAVKNNVLYDLALAPNIEIEVPIGTRWSLNTEYKCPWWLNSDHGFCYQLLSGGAEGRYWLGNRRKHNRLTGHFIGLYAEGGVYDFQFSGDGYQGKYYGAAGISYGYARQLARHFSLEFSFGIGYLTSEYKKYTPYEGDIIWTTSGRYNFIGPTKAKVSLVWLITKRR